MDFHAIVIDPGDPDTIMTGNDGGFYISFDQGETWDYHDHFAAGQFYNVTVDDSEPYRIGGGLQDNGSWVGPSDSGAFNSGEFMGRKGGIIKDHWSFVMGGDGFHVAFDPGDPDVIYAEWQGGNIGRVNTRTGDARNLKPAGP